MAEIYRLTNVMVLGENGWETIPFNVARQRNLLDGDTASEVENALVYFTCASSIHLKAELSVALEGLSTLWGAQTTSLNATEYMNSLPTSIEEENTGENVEAVNQ